VTPSSVESRFASSSSGSRSLTLRPTHYSPWRATVLLVLTTVELAARLLRGLTRLEGAVVSSTIAGYTRLLSALLLSTTLRNQRHSGGAVGSV
jgi:hypothetical protein